MAIELEDRKAIAPRVQEVLTQYGDCILSRLGVHDPDENRGIITLNIRSTEQYLSEFSQELHAIPGVNIKTVGFTEEKS